MMSLHMFVKSKVALENQSKFTHTLVIVVILNQHHTHLIIQYNFFVTFTTTFLCSVVDCEEPVDEGVDPQRMVMPEGVTVFNVTRVYSCIKGYTLNGSVTRTCSADAMWSGTPPFCNGKQARGNIHVHICMHKMTHCI